MASRRIAGPVDAPPSRRWILWVASGIGVLAILIAILRLSAHPSPPAVPVKPSAESTRALAPRPSIARAHPAASAAEGAPAIPDPGPIPASLRQTDEDGALLVDEHGDLVVGPEIRAFFEYYLSATGEESNAAIKARIVKRIHDKLKGAAADQATNLLDRYLAYREATRSISAGADGDLGARLEALRKIRRDHLGAVDAEKLFGAEERATSVAIAQQRVQLDTSLTPEERKAKIADLEADLPDDVRKARAAALAPLRQREDEQALRAAGATDEEIQRHRVETVGQEAADRLQDLDRKRAEWKKRLAAFQADRDAILRSSLDPAARDAAVEKLLESSFSPEERLRVKAADAIAAEPGR